MAIALDIASNGIATQTSPLTWSHTCTGSNLVLIVGVVTTGSPIDCSGVTYGGISLTLLGSKRNAALSQSSLWYLLNPPTGSNTVSVSFTTGSGQSCNAGAVSWTGVAQSGQPDAVAGNVGTGTPISVTVATIADNCWVAGVVNNAGAVTASLTSRWTGTIGANYGGLQDTDGPVTPAGNQEVAWTSPTLIWGLQAASFAPSTEPPAILEQEGFLWRADDGDEDEATPLANQDANITRAKNINTRLRVLIDAVGNPPSKQFQLEYRKKGTDTWNKV